MSDLLPEQLKLAVEEQLGEEISAIQTVTGGDINVAVRLESSRGSHFFKYQSGAARMLQAELKGLSLIQKSHCLRVPDTLSYVEDGRYAGLLMNWIERGRKSDDFWVTFGSGLAEMHKVTHATFGLDHDNYIGRLPQSNTPLDTWAEFYAEARILPMVRKAFDSALLDGGLVTAAERFCQVLPELFPDEVPSLVHGDLWSGNYLCNKDEAAVLIDPAVYFGHREMDLGMSLLFGGFSNRFYEVYQSSFPLTGDWRSRVPYTQLYPLLVHVNLFGAGYVSGVRRILKSFV